MSIQAINNGQDIFSYRETKDQRIFLYWHGKEVMVLKGKEAARFSARLEKMSDDEAQMAMAKITGNFKRGNEKIGKEYV